jgi:hypothetical protein
MMKIENHRHDLIPLFEIYFKTNNAQNLKEYLVANSNLPGPRANLELAKAFSDLVEDFSKNQSENLWQLNSEFIKISADEAPTNDPAVFVAFCGANGIGAVGAADSQYFEPALSTLKILANDSRWRMREAVCFGLQRMLAQNSLETLKELESWLIDGTLLELRAVAVAVAEPVFMKNSQFASTALNFHQQIFDRVLIIDDRKSENFRILRKALGFTLGVVICGVPEPGFELMQNLVKSNDADLLWIVKENLKKNRLVKNFPDEVELMKNLL